MDVGRGMRKCGELCGGCTDNGRPRKDIAAETRFSG
jgi:hypothetical protein